MKDILGTVAEALNRRVKREETVVYILIQIYKVICIENKQKDYPNIWLYRNWVSHEKLDKIHAERILADYIQQSEKIKWEFLSFSLLRAEMSQFLEEHKLPKYLAEEGWFQFRSKLVSIIRDQPILKTLTKKPVEGAIYLEKLCIIESSLFSDHVVEFDIILSDGSNVGGAFLIGDLDQKAQKKQDLTTLNFARRHIGKSISILEAQRKSVSDESSQARLSQSIDILREEYGEYLEKIKMLQEATTQDAIEDEFYR